jgi:glycosyltransferase involved in cell wall biosynthesis
MYFESSSLISIGVQPLSIGSPVDTMKLCILSKSDGRGGAYAAAYRLHQGLLREQIDSTFMVGMKATNDPSVWAETSKMRRLWGLLAPIVDSLPLWAYSRNTATMFSLEWVPDSLPRHALGLRPDVVHLHWVCEGYLSIPSLARFKSPLVWTLHDMWPFTGGCHYSDTCTQYRNSCGTCPQLDSSHKYDLSYCTMYRKRRCWANIDLTVVTPSEWLAKCARESALFRNYRVEVIPNGLDVSVYRPIDRRTARQLLNLPLSAKLILFGAVNALSDPRKGYAHLEQALRVLGARGLMNKYELVVFGSAEPGDEEKLGFRIRHIGRLNDDVSMALAYSAADVFVAPSTEDNLPNTVMEAMACGTPCVTFDIGGMPDMIEHMKTGYLVPPFDCAEFAAGIAWVLGDEARSVNLARQAREKVEREFALERIARRYAALYGELLA